MTIKKYFSFFIALSLLFSCSQKKEIELEDYKGLIRSMINLTEQSIAINNDLAENVYGLNIRIEILKMDPTSRKTALMVSPISDEIKVLSNKVDDIFLNTINLVIEKEEGVESWFSKNKFNQVVNFNSLYELKNIDSPKWTTKLLGVNSKESIARGEELRIALLQYRDRLILTVADSVLNDKNQLKVIGKDNLSSYEMFKKYLEQINHPNKNELLWIYYDLTFEKKIEFSDREILWNARAFQSQPLIGAIATLNYYRNMIRKNQERATKMLVTRVDRPLKPLHEYQITK